MTSMDRPSSASSGTAVVRPTATPSPYHRLHDEESFRVVRIAPGQWSDPIKGNLVHLPHDTINGKVVYISLPYKALSYAWGSSRVKEVIYLEDVPVKVTLNLFCALRYLRRADRIISLWIDALCINQDDLRERSSQVRLMRTIYQRAEEVVVFMGDGQAHRNERSNLERPPTSLEHHFCGRLEEETVLAEFLKAYQVGIPRKPFSAAFCAIALIRLLAVQAKDSTFHQQLLTMETATRRYIFECLRSFVVCPWWDRIWVVQEVAVSKQLVVHYGTVSVSWDTCCVAANISGQLLTELEPENLKVLNLFNNRMKILQWTRQKWDMDRGTDLVYLLQQFSDRQASDDRDKVYGLLGLAHLRHNIQPNYKLDTTETYKDVALSLIQTSLDCWIGDQGRKNHRQLPSWVPDWSTALDQGDKRRIFRDNRRDLRSTGSFQVIEYEAHYYVSVASQIETLIKSVKSKVPQLELPSWWREHITLYIKQLDERKTTLAEWSSDVTLDSIHKLGNLCYDLNDICSKFEKSKPIPFLITVCLSWHRDNQGDIIFVCRTAGQTGMPSELYVEGSALQTICSSDAQPLYIAIVVQIWPLANQLTAGRRDPPGVKRLFNFSYILRGYATRINLLYPRSLLPGVTYSVNSCADDWISLQSKCLGQVGAVGTRMFGWTDKKAALETLTRWACIAGISYPMNPRVPFDEVWIGHERLLAFAKIISASRVPVQLVIDWLETLLLQVTGAHSENSESETESGLYLPVRITRGGSISYSESPPPPPVFLSESIEIATDGRVFFTTPYSQTCTMGLGPASMLSSDEIRLFPDTPTPFVVRCFEARDPPIYKLIGDCLLDTEEDALFPEEADDESFIEGSLPVEIFNNAYPDLDVELITLA